MRPHLQLTLTRLSYCRSIPSRLLSCDTEMCEVAARKALGLPEMFSTSDLRDAYYRQAKTCHPDLFNGSLEADRFVSIGRAYDTLRSVAGKLRANQGQCDGSWDEYDEACKSWVGCGAEIVEELKADGMFREYLESNTQTAEHWRIFLAYHGGLRARVAPTPIAKLNDGKKRKVRRSV